MLLVIFCASCVVLNSYRLNGDGACGDAFLTTCALSVCRDGGDGDGGGHQNENFACVSSQDSENESVNSLMTRKLMSQIHNYWSWLKEV